MTRASLGLTTAVFLAALGAIPTAAHAEDPAGGILLNRTWLQSGSSDRTSRSLGYGAELGMVGKREPFVMTIGGFFALGTPDGQKRMRDVYDVRFGFGLKPKLRRAKPIIPFVSVGIDFLYVNTRLQPGVARAGSTFGFDARGGVFGVLGKRWIYQASVSYIGAIAPGTGDGLDGLALQIGLGRMIFD